MPGEWEPHIATWLAWPHYKSDWPGKFEPIPWVFGEIVRYLSRQERVEIIVNDDAGEKLARRTLERAHATGGEVRFHRWPTNRIWIRDSGCTFVVPSATATPQMSQTFPTALRREKPRPSMLQAVKWRFNAWAKYPNWQDDEASGSRMAEAAGAGEIQPLFGAKRVVLEGGAIEVNGKGTLITTEECLLSHVQERNAGMTKSDYEQIFSEYLGASNVIWLDAGIAGDDTHGHVDDIARFVSPDTVVTAVEADPHGENYEKLRENIRRLRDARTEDGSALATIDLPMPNPVYFEDRRLPASYANFYIANGVVLVPVFNDPNDRVALDIFADIFPEREVVGIYSRDLIWGLGAIHCMTQQQPALEL